MMTDVPIELSKEVTDIITAANQGYREGYAEALLAVEIMLKNKVRVGCEPAKGMPKDAYDKCIHKKYRYEDCIGCALEIIQGLKEPE